MEAPGMTVGLAPASLTLKSGEKEQLRQAIAASGGNRRKAAERLGIGERTLYRKLREYDVVIDTDDEEGDAALDAG